MVVALVLVTLVGGIALDARGPAWGQAAVGAWTWALWLGLFARADRRERAELVAVLVLATLGELFLGFAWGLYRYRLDNLPAFIPPGHALVYAAGRRMAARAPGWLPWGVALAAGPYVAWAAAAGIDTSAVPWFAVYLALVRWGPAPRLVGVMFIFALAIEIYGTRLGGWRYETVLPLVGLTSTSPPSCAGVFYGILDVLVLLATRLPRRLPAPAGRARP